MSATAIVTIKVLPESPQSPLHDIKIKIIHLFEQNGGRSITVEEQPVAFGLKALIVKAAVPEEKGTDFFESHLAKIPHVSSVSIEDYRRAFG